MEIWQLQHPEVGCIKVECGFDIEFRNRYPDWPEEPAEQEITPLRMDMSLIQRYQTHYGNPPVRLQVIVDGQPRCRLASVPRNNRISLSENLEDDLSQVLTVRSPRNKPHLQITSNMCSELLSIAYHDKPQVVEFDPPPGTRGDKRKAAMASSPIKRVAIPLAAGLGKSGWALAMLVIVPLLERVVNWLLSFLPDWELPEILLPLPTMPQIILPTPKLPQLSFPDIPVPDWVLFLVEYNKVWIPVIIGIVLGVLSLRNYRKSEQKKAEWRNNSQSVSDTTPEQRRDQGEEES